MHWNHMGSFGKRLCLKAPKYEFLKSSSVDPEVWPGLWTTHPWTSLFEGTYIVQEASVGSDWLLPFLNSRARRLSWRSHHTQLPKEISRLMHVAPLGWLMFLHLSPNEFMLRSWKVCGCWNSFFVVGSTFDAPLNQYRWNFHQIRGQQDWNCG